MRSAPFSGLGMMARVFAKAVGLLLIVDLVLVATDVDPLTSLTTWNTWGLVGHGSTRLYTTSGDLPGQLPAEALLAAHALAYAPKTSGEYRIIVLGDSAVYGWRLSDEEAFTGQLNAQDLHVDGKRVVAYNLGYPVPDVPRDVVFLDTALRYKPDMVIWFVSLIGLRGADPAANRVDLDVNRSHLRRIADRFGLQNWFDAQFAPEPPWVRWVAIHDPGTLAVWLDSLLSPLGPSAATQPMARIGGNPVPKAAMFYTGQPDVAVPNDSWGFLSAGSTLAADVGTRLLLVNEPILVGIGPNSHLNYDEFYERALYDAYREALSGYEQRHHIWSVDLWNVVPAQYFTDSAHHMDAVGWKIVADHLAIELQTIP